MRLSLMRPRNLTFLAAAALVAVLLANPASAEPSAGAATTPDLDLSEPSALAGPQEQEDALSSQPEPVYPDGEPDIETVESDDADEDAAPSAPIVVANIDKSRQEMTVFVDGVETYTWPVSTGIGGYSTPSGEFTTSSMNKIWYSRQWDNAPMPHAVFFTKKGHAIHATNETKKLGKPASHGCVRLSPKNAETFFNLVKETGLENTQVVLTGETPGGEYKVTQPQRDNRRRDPYGYYDRYGYYEEQPPVQRQRRRLFQPYYQAPPPQYQQQPRRKRWFFRN
jgi:lipoprotein-anchoring transpeptidase ErfK/SrfK